MTTPTENKHLRNSLYIHLAEVRSAVSLLSAGLESAGMPLGRRPEKIRRRLDRLEAMLRATFGGYDRKLPEVGFPNHAPHTLDNS